MDMQVINNHLNCLQYKSSIEPHCNKKLSYVGRQQKHVHLRPTLSSNIRAGKSSIQLSKQTWSHVNLNNMSQYSKQFAKETWTCRCGFRNNIDVWSCGVCGRDRP